MGAQCSSASGRVFRRRRSPEMHFNRPGCEKRLRERAEPLVARLDDLWITPDRLYRGADRDGFTLAIIDDAAREPDRDIVAIGMPLVLTYTSLIYWTFRGKVTLGPDSY